MKIQRIWAMPSKDTFTIEPIKHLLDEVMDDGYWIDPFSGFNSPASITNDINPDAPTTHHMDAVDFALTFDPFSADGILFDPPYSAHQIVVSYQRHGDSEWRDGQVHTIVKNRLANTVKLGGIVLCFGWDTNGFGKSRGFEMERVLIVPHGGGHNDTLVTVERKVAGQHEMFDDA